MDLDKASAGHSGVVAAYDLETAAQIAFSLRVSQRTLFRMLQEDDPPPVHRYKARGVLRAHSAELAAWQSRQSRQESAGVGRQAQAVGQGPARLRVGDGESNIMHSGKEEFSL